MRCLRFRLLRLKLKRKPFHHVGLFLPVDRHRYLIFFTILYLFLFYLMNCNVVRWLVINGDQEPQKLQKHTYKLNVYVFNILHHNHAHSIVYYLFLFLSLSLPNNISTIVCLSQLLSQRFPPQAFLGMLVTSSRDTIVQICFPFSISYLQFISIISLIFYSIISLLSISILPLYLSSLT